METVTSKDCYFKDICGRLSKGQCEGDTCDRFDKTNTIFEQALLSASQRHKIKLQPEPIDLNSFRVLASISTNINEFVKGGHNLFLYSSTTGNGKTSWAIKLIQSYVEKIWSFGNDPHRCLFINVPKFFTMLKAEFQPNAIPSEYISIIKENVRDADLVVWDDIGTKAATEFEANMLYDFINSRLDNNKSNIYTANLSLSDLDVVLTPRVASRIKYSDCVVELKGHDRRVVKVLKGGN